MAKQIPSDFHNSAWGEDEPRFPPNLGAAGVERENPNSFMVITAPSPGSYIKKKGLVGFLAKEARPNIPLP